jgi:hypothetical protein
MSANQPSVRDTQKNPPITLPTGRDPKAIEGEGSYTASRNYRKGVEKSVREQDSQALAEEAKKALEGDEGDELRAAEQEAKAAGPDGATARDVKKAAREDVARAEGEGMVTPSRSPENASRR